MKTPYEKCVGGRPKIPVRWMAQGKEAYLILFKMYSVFIKPFWGPFKSKFNEEVKVKSKFNSLHESRRSLSSSTFILIPFHHRTSSYWTQVLISIWKVTMLRKNTYKKDNFFQPFLMAVGRR